MLSLVDAELRGLASSAGSTAIADEGVRNGSAVTSRIAWPRAPRVHWPGERHEARGVVRRADTARGNESLARQQPVGSSLASTPLVERERRSFRCGPYSAEPAPRSAHSSGPPPDLAAVQQARAMILRVAGDCTTIPPARRSARPCGRRQGAGSTHLGSRARSGAVSRDHRNGLGELLRG